MALGDLEQFMKQRAQGIVGLNKAIEIVAGLPEQLEKYYAFPSEDAKRAAYLVVEMIQIQLKSELDFAQRAQETIK